MPPNLEAMRKSTRSLLFDVLLAALLMVFGVIGSAGAARGQLDRLPLDAFGAALVVVATVALVFRRRRPLLVLAVVAVAVSVFLVVGYAYGPALFPLAVAMYTVASLLSTRDSLLACAAALVALFGHAYPLVFQLDF